MFGLEFYGVENLTVRDVVIRDFRTFGLSVGGFRNVLCENVWFDLPNRMHAQNQDGFHFWGPGRFLTVRNTGGRVGDDFMNIGPDEIDTVSRISDVLVDGVFLDDADQAIRMLTTGTGRLDRVSESCIRPPAALYSAVRNRARSPKSTLSYRSRPNSTPTNAVLVAARPCI